MTNFTQYLDKKGVILLPWLDGMKPGAGYESLSQVVKGDAHGDSSNLTLKPVTRPSQSFTQTIQRIENTEQLNNNLSASATVEGSYGVFSASASADYLKNSEVNAYSLFFLVKCFARNSEEQIEKFVLSAEARNSSSADFRAKYGDYFVQGVISGGTFYALLQLATDSQKTKEEISAKLDAGYTGTFSISGKFSTDITTASSHEGVSMSSTVKATGIPPQWSTDHKYDKVDDIITAANDFPKGVGEGGEPILAVLLPYALLQDSPPQDESIDIGAIKSVRQTLTQIYLQAKQILDSVNYALKNPRQFTSEDLTGLEKVRQDMVNAISAVEAANEQLKTEPTKPPQLPPLPPLSLIPQRLWGGTLTNIAPPLGVVPTNLRFKMGVARSEAWAIKNPELQAKCLEYLNQVETDVSANLSKAFDFISLLKSSIGALDHELPRTAAMSLIANLVNERETNANALAIATSQQQAQYATFSNKNTNGQLDFLEKNLNPILWGITDAQYGGAKFWDELKTTTDALTEIASAWVDQSKGEEYYSFKEGLWKQLSDLFKQSMITFYNAA